MPKLRAKLSDWSSMIPVLQGLGPRRIALYKALRDLIERGHLAPGSKLPPSRQLAAQLAMARGAVVAAFEQLVADGFAEARVGAGTFVAEAVPRRAARHPRPRFEPEELPILPGRMGSSTVDETTFATFRRLLGRDLRRPTLHSFHYSDPRGSAALREEIASYLRAARAVRVHADQVMITSGSKHALDLVLRTVLSAGDAIWMEDPAYPAALALMRGIGLEVVPVPVDAQGLDPGRGCAVAPRAKAAYVTPSHQYPLGVAMTMRRRMALLDWARSASAWIIEDDYDSEFRYSGPPLTSLQGLGDAARVIYLGTFSKALFPGLRTGYVVLPEAILDRVVALRERTDHYPPTLAEGALASFLRDGHFAAHIRRARKRARIARDALVGGLAEGPIEATAPAQGLHLVARLPRWLSENRAVQLAAMAGLHVRPLSGLYLAAKPQSGLLIGFSGFAAQDFNRTSRKLSRLVQREI